MKIHSQHIARSALTTASFLLLNSLSFFTQLAQAGCLNDGGTCIWYTPLYSQNDSALGANWLPNGGENSMLCAPAASAMGLQGAIQNNPVNWFFGWTYSSFQGQNKIAQIQNMAAGMNTSPEKGTDGQMWSFFGARAPELAYKIGTNNPMQLYKNMSASNPNISLAAFQNYLQKPTAVVTNYGHYTKKTVKTVSTPTLSYLERGYVRDGGHVVTVRGFLSDVLVYNAPWYAQLIFSKLASAKPKNSAMVKDGKTHQTVENLPNGLAQIPYIAYKQGGSYYPLLEGIAAIRFQY